MKIELNTQSGKTLAIANSSSTRRAGKLYPSHIRGYIDGQLVFDIPMARISMPMRYIRNHKGLYRSQLVAALNAIGVAASDIDKLLGDV